MFKLIHKTSRLKRVQTMFKEREHLKIDSRVFLVAITFPEAYHFKNVLVDCDH